MKKSFIILTITLLAYLPYLAADDDERVTPVKNEQYQEECGSCHFAYQPSLLPSRSWQQLMIQLEDHFGDNAELEANTQKTLTDYLVNHSANFSRDQLAIKMVRRLAKNKTPLRITEMPYLKHEHDEIPKKMVTGNTEVKSLSYCDKCHTKAESGSYLEADIRIPGYGRWDDDSSGKGDDDSSEKGED
jgi:hypothetical protein